ncbi:MAG: nicotinamide riboside transporter PnuC [Lactobacillaceae bacterium]|jgi:nicotinamide mononucleotide transporter|nr:nicotinamide riboside transporter PnuC [Lactobacillaceae bacterium]
MLVDAFKNWSKYSYMSFMLGAGLIIGQTLAFKFEWSHIFTMVASLLGYLSVTLIVNNKRLNGWAGLISAAMFFYIGIKAGNPADAILNAAFIVMLDLPVILSKKWGDTSKVRKINESKNPLFWWIITPLIFIIIFLLFYFMEIRLQTPRPVIDSLAASLGLTASILTVAQISDSFYIWAIQNVMQAILWGITFIQGDATMIMMVMYIMYTLNSAVSFIDSPWFVKEMRNVK